MRGWGIGHWALGMGHEGDEGRIAITNYQLPIPHYPFPIPLPQSPVPHAPCKIIFCLSMFVPKETGELWRVWLC
ncbi:hypothetical protein FDUTEX481_07449 [Tolypothrix sp. PCC 7601]|nr:hypothetical protein FDUTEX481_07449 [Tolypothrix sp. PCC 7601]